MDARTLERERVDRCLDAAVGVSNCAKDSSEAFVFLVSGVLLKQDFPDYSKRLTVLGKDFFISKGAEIPSYSLRFQDVDLIDFSRFKMALTRAISRRSKLGEVACAKR